MAPLTLKIGNPILLLLEDGSINISHMLVSGPDKQKCTTLPITVTAHVEGFDKLLGPGSSMGQMVTR
jgi:hypothetical protein